MVGYLISAQARVGFYALSVNWLKTDVPWETGGVFPKSYNGHNRRGRTLSISCVIYHNIHYAYYDAQLRRLSSSAAVDLWLHRNPLLAHLASNSRFARMQAFPHSTWVPQSGSLSHLR